MSVVLRIEGDSPLDSVTPTLASQRLLKLAVPSTAKVALVGESVVLSLRQTGLIVTVTVPLAVLEWFVDVSDCTSGARVQDWCDYEGYDSTPREELDRDMAEDLDEFVGQLLRRDLRIGSRERSRISLEWRDGGTWKQAVPLAENGNGGS